MTNRILGIAAMAVATLAGAGCSSSSNPIAPGGGPEPRQTYTLSGVVTEMTATGAAPIAGAVVLESRSQLQATTDGDGRYRIAGLLPGAGMVRVTKDGYVTSASPVVMSADGQLDVRMHLTTGYVLSGVVFEMTAAGRIPIPDVSLYCDSCGSPEGHTFTSTDSEGRYRFAWSINGVHELQIGKEGYILARPSGSYGIYSAIRTTVEGDTEFDIEMIRR